MRRELIAQQLEPALRQSLQAPQLRVIALAGERPASDEVREPWNPVKYGRASPDDWFGVVPATARFARSPGVADETLRLVVKVNPREGLSRTLIPWIITQEKIALDRPYWEYRRAAMSDNTATREQQVYELAISTPALRHVLPRCYGFAADATSGEHAQLIDDALRSAAGWHAAFWDVQREQVPWAGPRPTTQDMIADAPLWRGLLDDARVRHPDIVTEKTWRRRHALID